MDDYSAAPYDSVAGDSDLGNAIPDAMADRFGESTDSPGSGIDSGDLVLGAGLDADGLVPGAGFDSGSPVFGGGFEMVGATQWAGDPSWGGLAESTEPSGIPGSMEPQFGGGGYYGTYDGVPHCWYSSDGYVYAPDGHRIGAA